MEQSLISENVLEHWRDQATHGQACMESPNFSFFYVSVVEINLSFIVQFFRKTVASSKAGANSVT
jgi:hypothetical protein